MLKPGARIAFTVWATPDTVCMSTHACRFGRQLIGFSRMDDPTPRNAGENVALPTLDYDTWKELVRAMGGRFNPEGIDPKAFIGWLGP